MADKSMADATIRNKSINGFKWAVLDNLANSGITFIVGLVLANLLSPVEFGILGILTIFINLSMTIIDGGFVTALIRKLDTTERDYNTVFYSNLFLAVILMAALILGAPLVAIFFDQTILADVLPVISVILVINALTLIPKAQFTKAIDFRRQAIASLVASLSSGLIGITLALMDYGVWSLVWQQISRAGFLLVCLWLMNRWRPRLQFSVESFRELFGFGSKLLAANLINSLYKDMFLAVIGKMFTVKDLGYYNRADQFNLIFSNNLSVVIQRVSMPALSMMQDDVEAFRRSYRKFTMFSAMATFALVFGLAAAARPVILTLLNEQWLRAATYLQIMCLYAAIYPLQQLNLNILNVMKRSDCVLRLEVVKKVLFTLVILVGFFLDLLSMLWAAVIYYYVEFFLNSWYSKRLIGYGSWDQVRDVLPLYLVSMGVSSLLWLLTFTSLAPLLVLVSQIVLALFLYMLVYGLMRQEEFCELMAFVRQKISKGK